MNTGGGFVPPASTHHSGLYFVNSPVSGNRPRIKLTLQDDAVFFGANF